MGRNRNDPRYVYDVRMLSYRDQNTGRLVRNDFVESIVDNRINDGFERLEDFAAAIIDGNAGNVADFQVAFLTELRNMHAQMAIVGKGGRQNMTASDWGRLGFVLREEYAFARDFVLRIQSGEISRAQMSANMRLYAEKIYHSYWNGRTRSAQDNGFNEERRYLDTSPDVQHCDPCKDMAAMGWVPIGTNPDPADGSTPCGSRDKCRKRYRNSRTGATTS